MLATKLEAIIGYVAFSKDGDIVSKVYGTIKQAVKGNADAIIKAVCMTYPQDNEVATYGDTEDDACSGMQCLLDSKYNGKFYI